MNDLQPQLTRAAAIPPGTEACHCCSGVERATPLEVINRPGLQAIAYRTGTYAQFRTSLQAGLSSSAYPRLANLRTRDDQDFTVALLDAVACAADVLTFYQERLANESYLHTARERLSLQELGRLIAYELRPGVAAETCLAFTLETPPVPPATMKPEPGMFIDSVPRETTLSAGLAVRSIPAPGQQPQVFETVESLIARPEWSAIQPWMNEMRAPQPGDQDAYLAGVRTSLKAGDAVLLVGADYPTNPTSENWEFRIVSSVQIEAEHDRTRIAWRRPLTAFDPDVNAGVAPQLFALRRRASVYGHNAPAWGSMSDDFRADYEEAFPRAEGSSTSGWPNFVISPSGSDAAGGAVDLDTVYGEVAADSYIVLARGTFNYPAEPPPAGTVVELFSVIEVSEVSREEFALSGKVTRLSLSGDNYASFSGSVRETSTFVRAEELPLAAYPVADAISGGLIAANVSAVGLNPGRRVIVRGLQESDGVAIVHNAQLVAAHALDAARCHLEIAPPLSQPLRRQSVVIHANVALSSHGERVAQVLGSGDASRAHQRFELKHSPLTYRAAANEVGVASELSVRVDDVEWYERSTLYDTGATDQVYTLDVDEQGRHFVQFGDGKRGSRLSSNSNNVRASYRKGLGSAANVPADSLTQLTNKPLGVKGVSNPQAAMGGTDSEGTDQARLTIPLITRTLGRAVSLLDYEDFARAFAGVAQAQAQMLRLSSGPAVVITIAGSQNTVIGPESPIWINLSAALTDSGDPHVSVRLIPHLQSTFKVGLKVKRDERYDSATVLSAVESALRAAFSFDRRTLGQPVQQSEVIAVAQAVAGVIAVDLDLFYGGSAPFLQTLPSRQPRLLARRMQAHQGLPLAAEILTLSPGPLDHLELMS